MNFRHHFHQNRLYTGLVLLLLSLTPSITSAILHRASFLTFYYGCYCAGIALISDYINFRLTGQSLLSEIIHKNKPRTYYFIIGIIGGLVLEGVATYLGGLWYYPFYSTPSYLVIAVLAGGFAWYFLCITLSYEAMKGVVDKFMGGNKQITKPFEYEQKLFNSFAAIGVFGLSIISGKILFENNFFAGFIFNINSQKTPYISFTEIMVIFLCLLLILEFIEFKRKRTSLIKDLLHGYVNPLIAIVLVSGILGMYMEFQNQSISLWIYTNWPWQNVLVGKIPVMVFFIGWPVHYIFFLSLYRAFGDNSSTKGLWLPKNKGKQ